MRAYRRQRQGSLAAWMFLGLLVSGCVPGTPGGGGAAGDGGGGTDNDNTGEPVDGGFDEQGLAAPAELPAGVENLAPSAEAVFPIADVEVGLGDVIFIWSATDPNDTNVDSVLHISDVPEVFESPMLTQGLRTAPDEQEHRLAIRLLESGTYYWGVEVTDGFSTVRRPAEDEGIAFAVSATASTRLGLNDAILLCPREGQPAKPVTTFRWSLGTADPIRAQVFVSRAGQENPFEEPLRVFEVEPPTAERRPLTEGEALPMGDALAWGLRVETDDAVLFSFEGQLGQLFIVEPNIPPSGSLTAPPNETVVTESDPIDLQWQAEDPNCEDELSYTVYLEQIGASDEPADLFGSEIQFTVDAASAEADLSQALADLDLDQGRWAWGVVADDGTDQTPLPDEDLPENNFRTFVINSRPSFVDPPAIGGRLCTSEAFARDTLVFSIRDDDGDTVDVRLTYASSSDDVFNAPQATLDLDPVTPDGDVVEFEVLVAEAAEAVCEEFAQGIGWYGVELDDGVNQPARRVVNYAAPSTGACCAPDGTCEDLTVDECPSGAYLGDGTQCATAECVVLIGACCRTNGSCVEVVEEDCTGEFQGAGTTCADADCPQPPPPPPPFVDCNTNGVTDSQDIETGTSFDCNTNGVPDECEDIGTVVDAGTLNPGTFDQFGEYNSAGDGNNLSARVCPLATTPNVLWQWESGPSDNVVITSPNALQSPYIVFDGVPGQYVFRFTDQDSGLSDTVTLTLSGP